jgi:AraC-like DNA-binding protein
MQHGAALLQTTDLPVSEIAHRVGYRQAAQFAKAFRRDHGLSPSGLRDTPRGRRTPAGMATVYVTGDCISDTDSIASAIGYAALRRGGPRVSVGRRRLNQRTPGAPGGSAGPGRDGT